VGGTSSLTRWRAFLVPRVGGPEAVVLLADRLNAVSVLAGSPLPARTDRFNLVTGRPRARPPGDAWHDSGGLQRWESLAPRGVVCFVQARVLLMTEPSSRRDRFAALVHHVLERLTAVRIRVGALRLLVRRGAIAPAEVEERLIQIEHDVDAAAELAKEMHTERSRS
jgi:hypothetical protein